MLTSRNSQTSYPNAATRRHYSILSRLHAPSLIVLLLVLAAIVVSLPTDRTSAGGTVRAQALPKDPQALMQFGPPQRLATSGRTVISPLDEASLPVSLSTQPGRRHSGPYVPLTRVPGSAAAYLVLSVEFENTASLASFKIPGVTVFAHKDKFADVFVERKQAVLDQLRQTSGIVWIEESAAVEVPPPPVRPRVLERSRGEENTEEIVRGGLDGLTGKGTIIAIVDSGVDFRNPDFITYDAAGRPSSRLLYLWDTTANDFDARRRGSKPPLAYPNRSSVGTLYTRAQLTAALRLEKSGRVSGIPASDLNGHGTACAGVAAGNGNNSRDAAGAKRNEVIGVAPEADLIAVRVSDESTQYVKNMFLLNAICEWLDTAAGPRPLVVSCSFGGHRGGHDGSRIEERQLDARFPLRQQGRAIVIAAGNEALNGLHTEVFFAAKDAPGIIKWQAEDGGGKLELYFENGDLADLQYSVDKGTRVEASAYVNPLTKTAVAELRVPPGRGELALFDSSGRRIKADVYISGGQFNSDIASPGKQISTPGTADNVITVGSYDWNRVFNYQGRPYLMRDALQKEIVVGQLSAYSNPGFSRSGTVKPEIVAPGEYYYASFAKLLDHTGVHTYNPKTNPRGNAPDTSGNYMLFNGTSAATPYVAGVIALVFQKQPKMTLGQVRELLKHNASQDSFTSAVPNPAWGYGKLDLNAVRKLLGKI